MDLQAGGRFFQVVNRSLKPIGVIHGQTKHGIAVTAENATDTPCPVTVINMELRSLMIRMRQSTTNLADATLRS